MPTPMPIKALAARKTQQQSSAGSEPRCPPEQRAVDPPRPGRGFWGRCPGTQRTSRTRRYARTVVAGRLRTTCQPLDALHDLSGQCTAWTRDVFTHVMGCVDHLLMGSHIGSARQTSLLRLGRGAGWYQQRGPTSWTRLHQPRPRSGGGSTSMFSPSMRGVAARRLVTRYCGDPRRLDAICRTRTCSFPDPGPHSSRRRPRPSSEGKRPGNRVARGSFAGLCGIQPGVSPLEHQTRIVADGARCPADTHARRTGR